MIQVASYILQRIEDCSIALIVLLGIVYFGRALGRYPIGYQPMIVDDQ